MLSKQIFVKGLKKGVSIREINLEIDGDSQTIFIKVPSGITLHEFSLVDILEGKILDNCNDDYHSNDDCDHSDCHDNCLSESDVDNAEDEGISEETKIGRQEVVDYVVGEIDNIEIDETDVEILRKKFKEIKKVLENDGF